MVNLETKQNRFRFGFTLIELLVVISIIALLASVVFLAFNGARKKARDTKRLSDMHQIMQALELFYDTYGRYPNNLDPLDCGGYDVGYIHGDLADHFIPELESAGVMVRVPGDPSPYPRGSCQGYRYYRYDPGAYGCNSAKGSFYVLGVTDFDEVPAGGVHPNNPGFSCPGFNWSDNSPGPGNYLQWVTGKFEAG